MDQSQFSKDELQTHLNPAIAQALDFDTALSIVLRHICADTDWDYGEIWRPEEDGTILKLSPIWCISTQDQALMFALEQFWECSQALILHPHEGLPGRVWSLGQPEWIVDVSAQSEIYFLRNQIAKAFGVKAGLGMPIFGNGQVQAVMLFLMSQARAEDQELIKLTQARVAQLETLLRQITPLATI